jgi:hypothetical protein
VSQSPLRSDLLHGKVALVDSGATGLGLEIGRSTLVCAVHVFDRDCAVFGDPDFRRAAW